VKIVVTDDQGRYLIPGLPKANYDVFVRGYGLVDSPRTKTALGKAVNLKATGRPERSGCRRILSGYLLVFDAESPEAKLFPAPDDSGGNGMPETLKDQGQWVRFMKTDSCNSCHQIGDKSTRTLPSALGHFNTAAKPGSAASSPAGEPADGQRHRQFRCAARTGEFRQLDGPRGEGRTSLREADASVGVERNLVLTEWDWATPQTYLHDEIATDRRNPTLNANGIIYGSPEASSDFIPWLDPVDNKAGFFKTEWRDPKMPTTKTGPQFNDSPYWGKEAVWDSHTEVHNPWMDQMGRVWLTAKIRPATTNRLSARPARSIPRPWHSRSRVRAASLRSMTPRRRRRRRSICASRRITCSWTRTTSCGSPAATPTTKSSAGST
jgi:hypothetical protein